MPQDPVAADPTVHDRPKANVQTAANQAAEGRTVDGVPKDAADPTVQDDPKGGQMAAVPIDAARMLSVGPVLTGVVLVLMDAAVPMDAVVLMDVVAPMDGVLVPLGDRARVEASAGLAAVLTVPVLADHPARNN